MEKPADPSEIYEKSVGLDGRHMAFNQLSNF